MMNSLPLSESLTALELKQFGLVTALIFIVLFVLFFPWVFEYGLPVWPWLIAIPLSLTALIYPLKLRGIHHYWMLFGTKLGWVNNRIILGSIFFILFTPLGVLMRLFGYDPLSRKNVGGEKSYRVIRNNDEVKIAERMENPY